jgi:hypothetical protein
MGTCSNRLLILNFIFNVWRQNLLSGVLCIKSGFKWPTYYCACYWLMAIIVVLQHRWVKNGENPNFHKTDTMNCIGLANRKTCGCGQSTVFIIAPWGISPPCISRKENTLLVQLAELPDRVQSGEFFCTLQLHPLTRDKGDS